MWMQLELSLLRSPRWMMLHPNYRLYYLLMISDAIEAGSDTLPLEYWDKGYMMLARLGLDPLDPKSTDAEDALAQLSEEPINLIDIDHEAGTITIRGFWDRYATIVEKREKDAERKREARAKAKASKSEKVQAKDAVVVDELPPAPDGGQTTVERTSTGPSADSPRTSERKTKTKNQRAPNGEGAPPARHPGKVVDTSPELGPKAATTARNGHRDHSNGNGNGGNGNGRREEVLPDVPRIGVDEARIPPPISPAAGRIFDQWLDDANGKFRKVEALRGLVRFRDNKDPLHLLAHLLELGKGEKGVTERLSMLHTRLSTNAILPAEWALRDARKMLNHDPGPRGGVPKSLTSGLQEGLDRRKAMSELAELGEDATKEIHDLSDQLISAWEPITGSMDDHMTAMHAFRLLISGDPIRGLAYIEQVTRSVPDDGGRVAELAKLCKILAPPHPECQSHAIATIRKLVEERKRTAKAAAG